MNESRLNADLKALSKRARPNVPTGFNAAVWSKIKSRENRSRTNPVNWLKALYSSFGAPQWAVAGIALGLLVGWSLGRSATSSIASPTESRLVASVTGEVIDMACYFDDNASGPEHAECARMCIASGLPVGLKGNDGKIYVLIGDQVAPDSYPAAKHESLNAQLAPYAAKIVTISGTIVSKQGVNVIENAQLYNKEAFSLGSPEYVVGLKAQFTHFL